jgi:hypothetical protein
MVVETGSLGEEHAKDSPLSTPSIVGRSGTSSAAVSDTDTETRQETTDRCLKEYEEEVEPRRLDIPVTTSSPISPIDAGVGQSSQRSSVSSLKIPTPSIQDIGVMSGVAIERPEPSVSASAERPPAPSIQDVAFVAQVPEATASKPDTDILAEPDTASGDVGRASLTDGGDRLPITGAAKYSTGSVLDDVLNDNDEGDPAGDEIPCVKCSDCAAWVSLDDLPEHACPASTSPVPSPSAGGSAATFGSQADTSLRTLPLPMSGPDPLRSVPADVPVSPHDRGIALPVTPSASGSTLMHALSHDVPEDVSGEEETADRGRHYRSRCAGTPISSSATSF